MKQALKIVALTLAILSVLLLAVSCAPASDPDKAKEALENNGYTAVKDSTVIPASLKLLTGANLDCVVTGTKTEGEGEDKKTDLVSIYDFATSDDAEQAYGKLEGDSDEKKEDEGESDWVFGRSGKMIYFGTKAGVKAAR